MILRGKSKLITSVDTTDDVQTKRMEIEETNNCISRTNSSYRKQNKQEVSKQSKADWSVLERIEKSFKTGIECVLPTTTQGCQHCL